jgi:hypothetical protein
MNFPQLFCDIILSGRKLYDFQFNNIYPPINVHNPVMIFGYLEELTLFVTVEVLTTPKCAFLDENAPFEP